MNLTEPVRLPTRKLDPALVDVLRSLQPGQRIKVTQTIRVGKHRWMTTVEGVYREIDYLATGISTDRVPEDDLVVPLIRFTKDNGEMTSIALDEQTAVDIIDKAS